MTEYLALLGPLLKKHGAKPRSNAGRGIASRSPSIPITPSLQITRRRNDCRQVRDDVQHLCRPGGVEAARPARRGWSVVAARLRSASRRARGRARSKLHVRKVTEPRGSEIVIVLEHEGSGTGDRLPVGLPCVVCVRDGAFAIGWRHIVADLALTSIEACGRPPPRSWAMLGCSLRETCSVSKSWTSCPARSRRPSAGAGRRRARRRRRRSSCGPSSRRSCGSAAVPRSRWSGARRQSTARPRRGGRRNRGGFSSSARRCVRFGRR